MRNTEDSECYIHGCKNAVHRVTKVVTRSQLCEFFSMPAETESDISEPNEGTAICVEHYGAIYRHVNPIKNKCTTCDQKIDISKSRICPEPVLVQNFPEQNTEFEGKIYPDAQVCYACYRSHLVIIKHTLNTSTSTDVDINSQIEGIKSQMCNLSDIHTIDQAYTHAVHMSAVHVGECLLKQTALLLPDVYDTFISYVTETTGLCNIQHERDIESIAKPSWLRIQLSSLLEHHLAYRCPVKRFRTVLYRHGGDLVHALSMSLGQNRTQTSRTSALQKSDGDKLQSNLTSICTTINGKFHTCIDALIHEDTAHPHVMENINIDQFISKLDPDMWRAVCLMTEPQSSKGNEKSNVRKIRQVFCTCALMFTTNSKCSFPFHTLIADADETCGGSSRLMRLLN